MTRTRIAIAAAVAAITVATGSAAAAAGFDQVDPDPLPVLAEPVPSPGDDDTLLDSLVLPPVAQGVVEAASEITRTYREDDRFSAVEVSRDRATSTVFWHGDVPAHLETAAARAGFAVVQTHFEPGALRRTGARLLREGIDGLDVTSVAMPADASRLDITVEEPESSHRTATEHPDGLTDSSGIPIRVVGTGNWTVNLNSLPAVGNGDSGGPGLLPTISPTGDETVYASTVISAMVDPSRSAWACRPKRDVSAALSRSRRTPGTPRQS